MKRLLILLVALLVLVSCDRFEHEPFEDAALEADMQAFFTGLSNATEDDLSPILGWYSEEYLNDKETKADIEHEYAVIFYQYGDDLVLGGELQGYWSSDRIEWTLTGTQDDSTFTIEEKIDYIRNESGTYKLYGNQVSPPELDETKPVVLVQYFTATTCGNCPDAARKLEEMEAEHGEQIVVIEYVANSDPAGLYWGESDYYGAAQPSTVFQGEYRIDGAGETNLAEYDIRYSQAVESELVFKFIDLEATVFDNSVDLWITWDQLIDITDENLMIKAVLLEENPGMTYIFDQSVYFENRAIAGAEQEFLPDAESASLSLDLEIELPEDVSVVVWLQNVPEEWGNSKVYNVKKIKLGE